MKHAREDYNERIQDRSGLIPEDEPVFLLRGQDIFAPDLVMAWAKRALEASKEIPDMSRKASLVDMATLAVEHAIEMINWQHFQKSKVPDYNPIDGLENDERNNPA